MCFYCGLCAYVVPNLRIEIRRIGNRKTFCTFIHRDNKEAENFIDSLLRELQPAKDAVMLDLGCGSGRHSKYLASKGYTVFGLDLAASSIREARKSGNESLYFLNWDMRKPFGKNNFDHVFSFFTSFGYFNSRAENNDVVKNMAMALKNEVILLIDYLNVYYAEDHLVAWKKKRSMEYGIISTVGRMRNLFTSGSLYRTANSLHHWCTPNKWRNLV